MSELFLPCGFCGDATPHSALVTFGARCKPCFDAYCLERPKPPENPQGRQAAFMPRRPTAGPSDDADPPPAVPIPARAHLPAIDSAPATETMNEPPAWATEA